MKATLETSVLLTRCLEAQRFTASKGFSSPILSGIHFAVKQSELTLRASTGSILFSTTLPLEDAEEGEVVLPASALTSTLKSLSGKMVSLVTEDEVVVITQGKVRFELSPLPNESFPQFPSLEGATSFLLPVQQFFSSVKKVLTAASNDETRPVLTAVLLETSQPNAVVATDGFRLFRIQQDFSLSMEVPLLLPARMLRDVSGLIEKRELTVLECQLLPERAGLYLSLGDVRVFCSLVSGDFPPYRSIIPEICAFSVAVDREEFLQAVKQALIFAKELSSIVVLQFENGEMIVTSHANTSGKARAQVPLLRSEGEPVRLACNGKFLTDFLSSLETSEIVLQGNESLKPFLLSTPEDTSLLYLVMPFKLQE